MAKFKVSAPERDYDGKVGAVQFADGDAVIDEDTNPGELAYCRAQGYSVEEDAPADDAKPKRAPAKRGPAKQADDESAAAEKETDK